MSPGTDTTDPLHLSASQYNPQSATETRLKQQRTNRQKSCTEQISHQILIQANLAVVSII